MGETLVSLRAEEEAASHFGEPEFGNIYRTVVENWNTGYFDRIIEDSFPISDRFHRPTPGSVLAFAYIRSAITMGTLATCTIPVSSGPYANRLTEKNNEILGSLPVGDFSGRFQGKAPGADGTIECLRKGLMARAIVVDDKTGNLVDEFQQEIDVRAIPLEVGSFDSVRGWYSYLSVGSPLCVWPYKRSEILLVTHTIRWPTVWGQLI